MKPVLTRVLPTTKKTISGCLKPIGILPTSTRYRSPTMDWMQRKISRRIQAQLVEEGLILQRFSLEIQATLL